MGSATLLLAAALGIAPMVAAGQAAAAPPVPDLTGYTETPVDPYVTNGEVYFQTPAGLLCAIRPAQGRAGCDGPLPGVAAGANEIVLASDQPTRGLRSTANPQCVKPTGGAAPVLAAGRKIVFEDFECAVGDGPSTVCTKGAPVVAWMVVAPQGTGVGPPTAGLPDGFPDPNDFVVADESYVVGSGPKNMFPVFTVAAGLACKMVMYSGGEIGCDGRLPGIENGDDEGFAQLPGPVGTRRAGNPSFATPTYPGPVKELAAGHRIDTNGATCMATDSGVACFGAVGGPPQGFQVTATQTTTFGGS